ncbi:neogenin isoform X2 [Agrilus planipennis]|uniref:Neogenin isoform X2 n=1 Tax=Agrilus planipennis TaxID=224129 RepID=A0A1W4X877_AGRPL|nr:neogenin isoform X2 [Agrilus planipennis]
MINKLYDTMRTNSGCFILKKYVHVLIVTSVLTHIQAYIVEFIIEPADTTVEAGQSCVLDCVVKTAQEYPSNMVTIQWLDQDRQPLSYLGDFYRSQLANGSLYIASVSEELSGNYQCLASLPNVGAVVSRVAHLTIATLSGFLQEPRDITVYPGQKAYFACRVQTSLPPRIRWLKDERPLQLDKLRMAILPSGALEIDEVKSADQGSYRCNVSSVNTYRLSNKANLIINEDQEQAASISAPSFIALPQSKIVKEGETVTLDCTANGNPYPTITWLKDGYTVDMANLDSRFSWVGSTTSLQIKKIEESDAGVYQCRAENREDSVDASVTLQVQVPPKFLKKPMDKVDVINKDTEFECSVYGKPEPKIEWLKNGEIIIPTEYYQIVNGNNLKILGLMTSDSGLFQCIASNPAGNIQASASLKVTSAADGDEKNVQEEVPGPPINLKASIVKARFVTLSWQPPPNYNGDIIAYSVYYKRGSSERERVQNTTRSRLEDINIGGLQPGQVYFFRVVAYSKLGPGLSSESLKVTTQTEERVPSAPEQFNAYATSVMSIHATWKPPLVQNGEIQLYRVYYMETMSSTEHNIETTNLQCDILGLSIYTEYSVWVVAINQNGAGAASEEKLVRTFSAPPSESPLNVTLEPASSTSIIVYWEPPAPDGQNGIITGYKLRYRKLGRKGDTITTPANLRSFTLSNLEKGSTYQVKLWALNVNGTGPPTEWYECQTLENDSDESQVPDIPTQLRVRAHSDKIGVMWNAPLNQNIKVRNYILGWGKGVSDIYTKELDEKQRSYVIEKLEPNSDYVISLRASNQKGAGLQLYANVRTRDEPPPEIVSPLIPPVGLKAQVLSSSSVVLYWTDTSLSKSQYVRDRYYVVKFTAEKSSKSKYVNVTDPYVKIDDLKPFTMYEFSVKVVKGRRESPWSMVVQNATWENPPNSPPKNLSVVSVEGEGQVLKLQWQPLKLQTGRVTGYVILYTTNTTKRDREWSAQAVKGDENSVIISDLEPNTEYFFKVQARNSGGNGPFSALASFRTGYFSNKLLIYIAIAGVVLAVTLVITVVIVYYRKRECATSPSRSRSKYQKSCQQIKPPDLWIHHDQMELKEKSHCSNDGASSCGAVTLPRSMGANEFDSRDNHPSNSLDKTTYVPGYMATAIVTPINTASSSHTSNDSTPSSRTNYPRTQYNISRAHIAMDQNMDGQMPEHLSGPVNSRSTCDIGPCNSNYASHPPIAHVPPGSTYAPGMNVTADPQPVRRIPGLGHPLKSFSVPAPPPLSAPGTPQPKHIGTPQPSQIIIRPNTSPYKKTMAGCNPTVVGTPASRITTSNPPPHTAEEVQPLKPSHSTEELNQEMANLEGLMITLNAITASEFEC